MTRPAMQSLDWHSWTSRITNKTKLHLYRVFILPLTLYGSESWAINKADIQWIDAGDQWCLRRILDIRWHDFVRNADIRRFTNQPPLYPSLSPVVSLSVGILHEWMRTQMLAKPSLNLLQRTGRDHRGGRAQPGWRTFMMTCLRWILLYMRLEIWCKICLSADWCLCTALRTRSIACYYWIGVHVLCSSRVLTEAHNNSFHFIYYKQQRDIRPLTFCNIQQCIHDTMLELLKITSQYCSR